MKPLPEDLKMSGAASMREFRKPDLDFVLRSSSQTWVGGFCSRCISLQDIPREKLVDADMTTNFATYQEF